MSKPTNVPDTTKPDPTTTKLAAPPRTGGNGNPVEPEALEAPEAPQPGKRPLTVLVTEKTYRHLRMLAASEGTNVSAVVIEAVQATISAKLKAAPTALAKDLG